MLAFNNVIHKFDFFKTPFRLHFERRAEISTYVGAMLSFCIFVFIIFFASQNDLFVRVSPQILDSTMGLDARPLVQFNGKLKAIGVQDGATMAGFVDPTIYSLIAVNNYFSTNPNGIGYKNEVLNKTLHLCSEADFPENPALFKSLSLTNNYCLEDNNFDLEGYWDEPYISYGSVELILCSNDTSNNTCQSYDEMLSQLNGKTFNMYYYDTVIDPSNYKNPVKYVMTNEWTYIDIHISKQTEYFFQNIDTKTDDGIILNSYSFLYDVQYARKNYDFSFADETDLISPRMTFSFISEKKQRHIFRIYEKASDLLAGLGGILNSLIFIGFIWAKFEQNFFIKKSILNSLYSFKIKSKKQRKSNKLIESFERYRPDLNFKEKIKTLIQNQGKLQKVETLNQKNILKDIKTSKYEGNQTSIDNTNRLMFVKLTPKVLIDNDEINPNFESEKSIRKINKGVKEIQKVQYKKEMTIKSDKKNSLNKKTQNTLRFQEFKKKYLLEKRLNLNIFQYIKLLFKLLFPFWRKHLKEEEEIFLQSNQIFENNLDCIEILKKVQEIEKLKQILLNKNQLKLFDFISKPMVYINTAENRGESKTGFGIELKSPLINERDHLKKLLENYENLKVEGKLTDIDHRLLENLDKDVEEFIANDSAI